MRLQGFLCRVFLVVVAELTFKAMLALVTIEVVEQLIATREFALAAPTAEIAWNLLSEISIKIAKFAHLFVPCGTS